MDPHYSAASAVCSYASTRDRACRRRRHQLARISPCTPRRVARRAAHVHCRQPLLQLSRSERRRQLARRRRRSRSCRRRARRAIGPPRAASGATWPTMKPWVAPEKRPSVISATSSPRPAPTIAAGHAEHLAHAGPAARAFVADDDDVAGLDRLALDRVERRLLAVEHARRTAMRACARCRRS